MSGLVGVPLNSEISRTAMQKTTLQNLMLSLVFSMGISAVSAAFRNLKDVGTQKRQPLVWYSLQLAAAEPRYSSEAAWSRA